MARCAACTAAEKMGKAQNVQPYEVPSKADLNFA